MFSQTHKQKVIEHLIFLANNFSFSTKNLKNLAKYVQLMLGTFDSTVFILSQSSQRLTLPLVVFCHDKYTRFFNKQRSG